MKKIIAILSAVTVTASVVTVTAQTNDVTTDEADVFLSQLSDMISQGMSDDYIGSLNLTIGSDTMTLDGEELKIDNEGSVPVIDNDSTLLPIRGVAEAIGTEVEYYAPTQTVSLMSEETEVNIQIGSREIEINGETQTMPVAAKIENDRTLIPLRAATEALGCDVEWDESSRMITLTRPYQTKRVIVYSEDADISDASASATGDGMTVLQFDTEEEARACVAENQAKGIEAEPDYIMKEASLSWGTDKINAPAYYSAYSSKQTDITVAVIDSGLDKSNSCFANKTVGGYDIYNNDSTPEDITGHGTHVASTVADVTSGFSRIKVMPVKVFGDKHTTSASIVNEAINYAVKSGAKVINLSLAGPGESVGQKKAVSNALANDVTVVAAAGNDNLNLRSNYYTPACIPGVVTVASVDSNSSKAASSNYGDGIIDIAAPGVGITGAAIGGGTKVMSGTSMASPHIAGVLALIRSVNPKYSSEKAVSEMKNAADSLGNSAYFGAGIVNMSKLIAREPVKNSISVTTLGASDITYTNATVNGTVSYSGERPSEAGIYFGASAEGMKKVASDKIDFIKNPFDMWYDLNTEANQVLSEGTTYYYQCYAIQSGTEYKGEIQSFTTKSHEVQITVTTTEAKYVTDTNAVVYGTASYGNIRPTEVGIYFGTSERSMKKVAGDKIDFTKNPFDMWYDLNTEANQYLTGGKTYYWQCYAIVNSKEYKGETKSFTTPIKNPGTSVYVTTGGVDSFTGNNATVHGSAVYSGERPSEVGLYFGTSDKTMVKAAHEGIDFTKNPFDIWYDLNAETNQFLSSGQTYYYKFYAIQNGVEVCGETKSFVMP